MNRSRLLGAAVALAAASALLTACSDDGGSGAGADAPATAAAPEEPSAAQVALPDGVLPLPEPNPNDEAVIADAGRYRVSLGDTLALDVDLPVGAVVNSDGLYTNVGDMVVKMEPAPAGYGVPADPCQGFANVARAGGSVDALVRAITDQEVYRTSDPRPVALGDASGQYLELRIPPGYDASACPDGQIGLPGNPGSNNNMDPGYVGRWWIVDAGGQRAVVQVFCVKCDQVMSKDTTRMVEGITFSPTGVS